MARFARAIVVAAALTLPLGGCVNFDPADWFAGDWFNTKKPLPGERKELFPGGVPGVSRGVPPDLVKGNQAAALQDQQEEAPSGAARRAQGQAEAQGQTEAQAEGGRGDRRAGAAADAGDRAPAAAAAAAAQPQPQRRRKAECSGPTRRGRSARSRSGVQWPDPPAPR